MLSSCSTNSEVINCAAIVNNDNVFSINGKVYSGICNAYSADGLVLESKYYKNGIIYKVRGFHYPGGETKFIGFYKNNLPNGKFKQYWLNGSLEREGKIKEGFYYGKWKFYDENGVKQKTVWFNDQGQQEKEIINQ